MDAISETFTGVVVILAAIAAGIVVPYAARELHHGWRALGAQFAGAFAVLLLGITYRMGAAYYFWMLSPIGRLSGLDAIRPHILAANLLLMVGIAWVIRSVTVPRTGEWGWILSVLVAVTLVALLRLTLH